MLGKISSLEESFDFKSHAPQARPDWEGCR